MPAPATAWPSPTILGGTDEFDQAIAAFAQAYAEQNEEDYSLFRKLIKKGELPCSKKSGAKK